MGLKWHGGRFWFPAYVKYTLCLSEAEYFKEMKRLKIKDPNPFVPEGGSAATHTFHNVDEGTICVVTIKVGEQKSYNECVALLVHEAVHVFQKIIAEIGEKNPGDEFQAYGVQGISLDLIEIFSTRYGDELLARKFACKQNPKHKVVSALSAYQKPLPRSSAKKTGLRRSTSSQKTNSKSTPTK